MTDPTQGAPRHFVQGLLLSVVVGVLLAAWWGSANRVVQLPFSEFREALAAERVSKVIVSGDRITGELENELGEVSPFYTLRVEPELAGELEAAGVEYEGRPTETFLTRLFGLLVPVLLIFGLWMLLFRRAMGRGGAGLMSVGKSKAKVYVEAQTGVRFDDVAGVDEAKEELQEVVAFLRDPQHHGRLGARMPKGVLLVGPPGTGKTLLARAVAGEAGVPFFSISGSEFVEMFVGLGAARVRDLFEQARAKAPCIVFVDELDALGRARNGGGFAGGHDEKEQTLNQLLVELDGFDPTSGIVLLAATNRPEVLDPALLRAGRFDRQVLVDRPDKLGREAILDVHLRHVKLGPDVEPRKLAELTPGFSGADLANLGNEAALVATRRSATQVEMGDFTAAIERVVAGLEKKTRVLGPKEREIVAHHEMGHALVATALPETDPVHKISIIPRGLGALGYTMQRPSEERFLHTREELESRLAVLLGGRAAEWLVYGHLSTGASDDLARATEIARDMVTRFAMVPELGNATWTREEASLLPMPGARRGSYSEETAREIDSAVRQLVDAAFERARSILEQYREVMLAGAQRLLVEENLDEAALAELFAPVKPAAWAA